MREHVTVGDQVEEGWSCVDDAGRRVHLPRTALDEALRFLRAGQRLAVVRDAGGTITHARLP